MRLEQSPFPIRDADSKPACDVAAPRMASWLRVASTVVLLAVLAIPLGAQQVGSSASSATGPMQGRQVGLRDQLRVGLRALSASDFAFIDKVVMLVNQGKLPRRLVDGTFLWARKRVERYTGRWTPRPMIYFRPALILRARRIGVRL